MSQAIYLEWTQGNSSLSRRAVPEGSLSIGRDPASNIHLSDSRVSWHHAEVTRKDGRCSVIDLGSANGAFLNGARILTGQAAPFSPGDTLRVGACDLRCVTENKSHPRTGEMRLPADNAGKKLSIGRSPGCDICLPHPDVSWEHAALTRGPSGWTIQDLHSTNGTFVNDRPVTSAPVAPGDQIRIGLTHFRLDENRLTYQSDVGLVRLEATDLIQTVWRSGKAMTLLHGVSLTIQPREFVAVIGSSGAGKTTLLRALNGRCPPTHGQVFLNGIDFYAHPELFRMAIGYVPQEDIVHPDLKVESALRYAARLRLPTDTAEAEITTLVTQALSELGLDHRRDHPIRLLSGGERKRVNIAMELLTRPSVMFLDEPTTGLDAGLERRVTRQLRVLANEGRTIIVVTHSTATLEEYDRVAFMSRGGYLAFYGPPRDALTFFGVKDYAEAYDVVNDPAYPEGYWADRFRNSRRGPALPIKALPLAPAAQRAPAPGSSAPVQFGVLLARYAEIIRSDTRNLIFWLAQAPIIGLILAILFKSNIFVSGDGGSASMTDAPPLLFLLAFSSICFGMVNAARELVKEKLIYTHERHTSLRLGPYLLSKFILLGLVSLCQCAMLLGILRIKIDFGVGWDGLLWMLLLLWVGAVGGILLGLLLSAMASSTDQAITLVAAALLAEVIFSGLHPLEKLDESVRWVTSLCATRWSYGGLCGLTNIPDHFREIGMGEQLHDVLKTTAASAWASLIFMAAASFLAVWGVMWHREKKRP